LANHFKTGNKEHNFEQMFMQPLILIAKLFLKLFVIIPDTISCLLINGFWQFAKPIQTPDFH